MRGISKLKYTTIFFLPATVAFSFLSTGFWAFAPLILYFIIMPIVDHFLPKSSENFDEAEKEIAENDPFYSALLFLLVPIQLGFLIWFLTFVGQVESILDLIAKSWAMGIMCGVIGINVGHELGHRHSKFERFLGEVLLLTSLENHFLPYHNRGHHLNVATPSDPATARKNEPIYLFWFRSQIGSYFQAWDIENTRMKIMRKPVLSFSNKMVFYTILHFAVFLTIFLVFGWYVLIQFIIVAIKGILLLELVNYIEHYGLLRHRRENGTYVPVKRIHSWNSNHSFGRLMLFELSRHSDHHYKADRPYQVLESHDESPLMPTGYIGMMIIALFPPLFFRLMNPRVEKINQINLS
ncbi:MAG: alkane 1-monooxygenase [Bacteroidota bacterium]